MPDAGTLLSVLRETPVGNVVRAWTGGKYDTAAVIGITPLLVVALTTSLVLPPGRPSGQYVDTIVDGLREAPVDQPTLCGYAARLRAAAEGDVP